MTSKRDNDTPAQPQTQAMGAATRDPRRGEIPVESVRYRPFDDFPALGVSRTNEGAKSLG